MTMAMSRTQLPQTAIAKFSLGQTQEWNRLTLAHIWVLQTIKTTVYRNSQTQLPSL